MDTKDSWCLTREKVRHETIYSAAASYYGYEMEGVREVTFINRETGAQGGNEITDVFKAEHSGNSQDYQSDERQTKKKKKKQHTQS